MYDDLEYCKLTEDMNTHFEYFSLAVDFTREIDEDLKENTRKILNLLFTISILNKSE